MLYLKTKVILRFSLLDDAGQFSQDILHLLDGIIFLIIPPIMNYFESNDYSNASYCHKHGHI